jgi:hypothetical protein
VTAFLRLASGEDCRLSLLDTGVCTSAIREADVQTRAELSARLGASR